MRDIIYISILISVLAINAFVSYRHHIQVNHETQALRELMEFKSKGTRYTAEDAAIDKAVRDQVDANLQQQIDFLNARLTECLDRTKLK